MRAALFHAARSAAVAALLFAAPLAVRADAPCADDAARLCPGVPASGGQLWACLQRNQLQLSSACVRNIFWFPKAGT